MYAHATGMNRKHNHTNCICSARINLERREKLGLGADQQQIYKVPRIVCSSRFNYIKMILSASCEEQGIALDINLFLCQIGVGGHDKKVFYIYLLNQLGEHLPNALQNLNRSLNAAN